MKMCKRPNKNYILILIIGMLFSLSLYGCNNVSTIPVDKNQPPTTTVTDCVGREVTIPVNPKRIACLCPEAGHALAMYGEGDRIVAAVGGMQRDLLLVEMYPHIKDVPVPKTSGVINIEELAFCKPDIVFIKGDTLFNDAEMEKLAKAKIPVIGIEFNSIEEQQYAMKLIAKTVGADDEALAYVQFYQDKINLVQERVQDLLPEEKVRIYHAQNEATRTTTPNTLPAEWTEKAGVINVSVEENLKFLDGKHYASIEQILLWNPDYIFANDPNVVPYIMNHEQWQPLQAVKNNRVIAMPNGVTRWGHFSSLETPMAVLWTAKTVYPERFKDVDMVKETKWFYNKFFDWNLSDADIHRILNGEEMRIPK